MQAIVQDSYGSADVLEQRDIEQPEVGADDVLVRVHAAGVDRGALHLMTGKPYLVRAAVGLRKPRARVPGTNVSGRVEAVGKDVTRVRVGDDVYGTCQGAFAEYACAHEDKLAPKPASLSFEQAAVVPHPGSAALQARRDHGKIEPSQTVLIIGAAGAVGSFAVQLAKAFGAEVTGVCSTGQVDLVRSLGADHVVDYTVHEVPDGSVRFDLILDIAGNRSVAHLRRGLAPRGTLVIVGGERGGPLTGGLNRQLWAHLCSPFTRQKLGTFVARQNRDDMVELNGLIDAGKITIDVDRRFPLQETPDAVRYLESGQATGRIVVTVP